MPQRFSEQLDVAMRWPLRCDAAVHSLAGLHPQMHDERDQQACEGND